MKKQYIKLVKKRLSISYKTKKIILQDLNEIFDSAMEHGESEEQVIHRLGKPEEYADECCGCTESYILMSRKRKLICFF